MASQETCFLCFVQQGAWFWKCLCDNFWLISIKGLAGAIYKEQNREMETNRVLDNLRMPKPQEIFTTVANVCHHYKRLTVLQNVFTIFLLWASEDIDEKLFEETVYK